MAVSMPLVAAFMSGHRRSAQLTWALAAAATCVAAFFVTTPYAIFAMPEFLNGFGTQAAAFSPRQPTAEASWLIYLKHLRLTFGWPGSLLAVAGLALAILRAVRGPGHVRWALLLVFPAVYFYLITGWTFLFARYALPMVPFITLWIAIATISGVSLLRRWDIPRAMRTSIIAALTLAAVLPPLYSSVQWVRGHGVVTTQTLAWQWVRKMVWPNSVIVSEVQGFDLPAERYRAETVRSLVRERPLEALEAAGVQWVVLSSDAWERWSDEDRKAGRPPDAYDPLVAAARVAKVIMPSATNPGPQIHILELTRRAP
jgi:hypothetical protein